MKLIFGILICSVFSTPAWSCWNSSSTCTTGTGDSAGQACRSPGTSPKVCFIDVSAVGCYYIYNSTGKDVYIPTKTVTEFQDFVSHPPAGMSATAATIGTSCFPSCYMLGTGCPSTAGSATSAP